MTDAGNQPSPPPPPGRPPPASPPPAYGQPPGYQQPQAPHGQPPQQAYQPPGAAPASVQRGYPRDGGNKERGAIATVAAVYTLFVALVLGAIFAIDEFGLLSLDNRVLLSRVNQGLGYENLPGMGFAAPPLMVIGGIALLARQRWGRWIALAGVALTLGATATRYLLPSTEYGLEIWAMPGLVVVAGILLLWGKPARR